MAPKCIPVVVAVDLEPKTEPRITAAMSTNVNKNIGIKNLFLQYHGYLEDILLKNIVKNILRRRQCETYSFVL
jgi:hypothetical protein